MDPAEVPLPLLRVESSLVGRVEVVDDVVGLGMLENISEGLVSDVGRYESGVPVIGDDEVGENLNLAEHFEHALSVECDAAHDVGRVLALVGRKE